MSNNIFRETKQIQARNYEDQLKFLSFVLKNQLTDEPQAIHMQYYLNKALKSISSISLA